MMHTSSIPASFKRAPMHRPEKPPPISTTVCSSEIGARSIGVTYGSSPKCANFPVGSRYWALPSGRSRLSRSSRYLARRKSWSIVLAIAAVLHDACSSAPRGAVLGNDTFDVDGRGPLTGQVGSRARPVRIIRDDDPRMRAVRTKRHEERDRLQGI